MRSLLRTLPLLTALTTCGCTIPKHPTNVESTAEVDWEGWDFSADHLLPKPAFRVDLAHARRARDLPDDDRIKLEWLLGRIRRIPGNASSIETPWGEDPVAALVEFELGRMELLYIYCVKTVDGEWHVAKIQTIRGDKF